MGERAFCYHMQNRIKIGKLVFIAITLAAQAGCASVRPAALPCASERPVASRDTVSEADIAALFDRWNEAIGSQDPRKVVSLYADGAILLPTFSDKPRLSAGEKEDYFRNFLAEKPSARIDMRQIEVSRDMASDTGLYTFTLGKSGKMIRARYSFVYRRYGQRWLIVSHHSSVLPEKTG